MNRFRQHIPGFIEVDTIPEWVEFETTDDLLGIDIVENISGSDNFSHFVMDGNLLLAIWVHGTHFVVGRVEDASGIDLPQWKPE